jgi:hypothetical protein
VSASDYACLLASAPAAHRRALATASRLPREAPADALAAALLDRERIALVVRGLSPGARRLVAEAAFLGETVVANTWNPGRGDAACELERHGLAFAFKEDYWVRYFVPAELHPMLADALAAPYARGLAGAEPSRWLEAPLQLAHDMVSLWAYLARAPVRVKTDGGVYKRDVPKLRDALPALELHAPRDFMAGPRLSFALALLAEERLVRVRVDDAPYHEERRELVPAGNPAALLAAPPEELRSSLLRHAHRVELGAPALALAHALEPREAVALTSFGAALRTACEKVGFGLPEVGDFALAMAGLHFPWLAGAVAIGLDHAGVPNAVRATPVPTQAAGRIICQANFELIALSPPTPAERLALALACEPVSGQAHVFRLTRRSVEAAHRSGTLEGGVTAALERLAGELPQNVARSLVDWTSSVRRPLRLRTAMMIDAGDPRTADDLIAGELGRHVVERLGPSHLAIRADDLRAVKAALAKAGHGLDAGLDRVSGRLGDRAPMRTDADLTWEPDAIDALPAGRQVSTLGPVAAVPEPALATTQVGARGNGQLAGDPDWQNDPLEVVLDAIERGTDVLIVYAGAPGTTLRQITPYEVEGAAVHAYCHLRGDERSFWLASIQEAVALD